MHQGITFGINFIGLIAAVGMGVYLIMRSSRRPETWLSALAIWAMGGYYLNEILALISPPAPAPDIRLWLFHLMLFWPRDVFELGWKGWLLGWLPAYSIVFWYHATLYMLPGSFNRKRWLGAFFAYALALAIILVKTQYRDAWIGQLKDPLYDPPLTFPLFALSAIGFLPFMGLSLYNLKRASSDSSKPHAGLVPRLFILAALLASLSGLIGILSYFSGMPIPQGFTALSLLIALLLAGIGVARYNRSLDFQPSLPTRPEEHPTPLAQAGSPAFSAEISMHDVEMALRNLHNYAYLAHSPLANLRLVTEHLKCMESSSSNHIDRGKALSAVLSESLRVLKPSPEDVPNSPSRSWYPYIILWDAYVENKPNLEIMSRLYISEGTFNRTRKTAISSVTQLLLELETNSPNKDHVQ